jgi:hypothetical protein
MKACSKALLRSMGQKLRTIEGIVHLEKYAQPKVNAGNY